MFRCSTPRKLPILRTRDAIFYLPLRRRKRGLQVALSRGRSIKIPDIYDVFILERYGTSEVNPVHAPGVRPELSNGQVEEKLLDAAGLKLYQAITEVVDVPRVSVPVRHTLHHHATVACLRSASSVYMTKAKVLPTYLKGERWTSPYSITDSCVVRAPTLTTASPPRGTCPCCAQPQIVCARHVVAKNTIDDGIRVYRPSVWELWAVYLTNPHDRNWA